MLQRSSRPRDFFRKFVVGSVKDSATSVKDTCLKSFFHADRELRNISSELDSFDGKKDPIRCNLLVNQLRTSQDRVISIIFQLMDECRCQRAPRDYRMKFPDEILLSEGSESLNGQIWFGAECLSAGSNILNHTRESTQLRPMAKRLTSNLDQLRRDLRDLVESGGNASWINDEILTLMVDFDKVFATFEYEYVRTMLPIRTVDEIERLQEVAIIFSETLIDCVKRGLIQQEEIDEFQPIVMIAVPRLAIVRGLLYSNNNRIYAKHRSDMCTLFQPFHGPLQSIRRLLRGLTSHELLTLEKMLANDQAATLEPGKTTQNFVSPISNNTTDNHVAEQQTRDDAFVDSYEQVNNYSRILVDNLQYPIGYKDKCTEVEQQQSAGREAGASSSIDIKVPEPCPSSSYKSNHSPSPASSNQCPSPPCPSLAQSPTTPEVIDGAPACLSTSESDYQLQRLIDEFNPQLTDNIGETSVASPQTTTLKNEGSSLEESTSASNQTSQQSAKIQALFVKQAQQLLHRMFVAIAGVADQLQSNFASDLRFILRNIFVSELEDEDIDDGSTSSSPIEEGIEAQEIANLIDLNSNNFSPLGEDNHHHEQGPTVVFEGRVNLQQPTSSETVRAPSRRRSCNCLDNEVEFQQESQTSPYYVNAQTNPQSMMRHTRPCRCASCVSGGVVYSEQQLLSQSQHQAQPSRVSSSRSRRANASGDVRVRSSRSQHPDEGSRVCEPQDWVPDELVVACFRCNVAFTFFRRRHHCRSCGQIFCDECSKYRRNLNFCYNGPVRVCESCWRLE